MSNLGEIIRVGRAKTNVSQSQLAKKLGYKNGQYISNVERGQCSLPVRHIAQAGDILNIHPENIANAMISDYADKINNAIRING